MQIGENILVLCALFSLNALAFSSLLQPEEIQDAYSFGQTNNHEELAKFVSRYQHNFEYPSDKPFAYVKFVEFETPYEQIVLRSQRTVGYTKFQAAEDYRANRRLVIIRVVVWLRIDYAGPAPPADDFKVVVSQTKRIDPQKVASTVPCNPYDPAAYSTLGDCTAYTREIDLNFDARQFAPGRATIKVVLPGDRSQETSFDLDKLK